MEELGLDITGLMDSLGRERCFLVGHDWGAAVAWGVALTFPERVTRLGILNVPHLDVMARFIGRDLTQSLKSWYIAFFQIPGLPEWLLSRNGYNGLTQILLRSSKPGTFTPADLEDYRLAWSQPGALTAMINWYRAVARYRPAATENMRLNMPVWMLWGPRDIALSQKMAQPSIDRCHGGKLIYFENATHWVQHEEADAVTKALLEFLT
jgi:pimeloyl-ACP methyl ester carboxylesterase